MKYFMIAGEASGDLHAGRLIASLRKRDSEASFCYLGGDCMEEASGVAPVIHYKRMAYMGFSAVLSHLPEILGNMKEARRALDSFAPDAVVLIDYPSFNLKIARYAWEKGIPVYYYISPKVWAWKEYRVKQIKKYVRKVFSILPFETEFFARHGYAVDYVGNPTVNEIEEAWQSFPSREEFLSSLGLSADERVIALLPGSRLGEIRSNLPMMARAAERYPGYRFVVAGAPNVSHDFYTAVLRESGVNRPPLIVDGSTYPLLFHARAALVTSGTATLETAIIGTPQAVCYRANGSKLAYNLMSRILKVKYVSLPNLIADREVVPELLLHHCTEENMAAHLDRLLPDSLERRTMLDGYAFIQQRLGTTDSADTAARDLMDDLKRRKA